MEGWRDEEMKGWIIGRIFVGSMASMASVALALELVGLIEGCVATDLVVCDHPHFYFETSIDSDLAQAHVRNVDTRKFTSE